MQEKRIYHTIKILCTMKKRTYFHLNFFEAKSFCKKKEANCSTYILACTNDVVYTLYVHMHVHLCSVQYTCMCNICQGVTRGQIL